MPRSLAGCTAKRRPAARTWCSGTRTSASSNRRQAGIGYVSTSSTPISELPARLGDIDLVLEATGAAAVIAPAMSILGRNGVCVLASVTEAGRNGEIDLGAWNRQMVLGNRLIFG